MAKVSAKTEKPKQGYLCCAALRCAARLYNSRTENEAPMAQENLRSVC